MTDVSIIMAAYNGERYIDEQIESIVNSDYERIRLYVYDDLSKDSTAEHVREWENRYPDKVKLIVNEENYGPTVNFLNGLKRTVSEEDTPYYMFSDQDDVWFPEKISVMIKRIKKLEDRYGKECPVMVFSDAMVADEDLCITDISFHKSQKINVRKRNLASVLIENKCSGCMMMFNRALAGKINKIPECARYHDWWITLIATVFGYTSYIDDTTIIYRQHDSNVVGSVDFVKDCACKFISPKRQKMSLDACMEQAAEFLEIYFDELESEEAEIIAAFATLRDKDCITKRKDILKYRFFKSSLIKDIGVMFNV